MTVTVKEILDCLDQEALTRLVKVRNVKTSRTLKEKRKTLAHSYKGDLEYLINEDLRKGDLINIISKAGIIINEAKYFVPNLAAMKIDDIKKLAIEAFCHEKISKEMVAIDQNAAVKLYSNKYTKAGADKLNIETLRQALKGIDEVRIASAFYDTNFYKDLFEPPIKRFRKIQIVLNGLFGQRLKKQKEDLADLYKIIEKHSQKAEIRLLMQNGIFHSKLYLFKGISKTSAFVGSLNSTSAGLLINEEILVNITGNTMPFEMYFNEIWKEAKSFEKVEPPSTRNLICFFRTGILYFKPEYQFQLTYNPFSELLSKLSDDEKGRLVEPIPNSDLETGIGAFSIPVCLDMRLGDLDEKVSRASIKPYSIETNLGYWVPSAYEENVTKIFVNKRRKKYYLDLKKAIDEKEDEFFFEEYRKYRKATKDRLTDTVREDRIENYINQINNKKSRSTYDPFNDEDGFKRFLDNFKNKLNDSKYIEKVCQRFISGALPEIWEDHAAYIDFKNSFFEYLEFIDGQNISRSVPKTILDKIKGIKHPKTIEDKIIGYLREFGWGEKDWPEITGR